MKSYEPFTWMVHGVFIPPKPCRFQKRKGMESPLLLTMLMRDKYLLHMINDNKSGRSLKRPSIHL
jgi:hypothetical protein